MKKLIIISTLMILTAILSANEIQVKKIKGNAYYYNTADSNWYVLQKGQNVSLETIIRIPKESNIYLTTKEEEPVIPGPFQGMLGKLLSDDKRYSQTNTKQLLNKIPNGKQGDRKIEITIQSAAVVKGSKEEIKTVPYRWRSSNKEK